MTTALTKTETQKSVSTRTQQYIGKSKSERTIEVYRAALIDFDEYCILEAVTNRPAAPQTIADYISELADRGLKVSTIRVRLAAIAYAHRIATLPDPTTAEVVRATVAGIARQHGTRPNKKAPMTLEVLRAMLNATPGKDLISIRDRAILILDYGGMFRRSELVALDVSDLSFKTDRLIITVRRSKTDQEGAGLTKHFPLLRDAQLCPVRAVRAWLRVSRIKSGPLFRPIGRWQKEVSSQRLTDKGIVRAIKDAAKRAGLDPDIYSGHSARRGGITSALQNDALERDLMAQTGHRDINTLLDYREDAGVGAVKAVRAAFGEKQKD